ncbi:MAG: LuxR C-terminal-related transcriptional regulator [Roseburia sp.]
MNEKQIEKPRIFRRERIQQKFDEMMKKQVLFVTAPMGYGKTTIVRESLNAHDYEVVEWFYFGKNADEDYVFTKQMENVFAKNGNEKALEPDRQYTKLSYYELETYARMLKQTITKETVCVFDDYHLCSLKYMNKLIELVAGLEIPHFHLIVISRYYPELPYVEMQMKGECELLEKKDLYLSPEEIALFFQENNCELAREELQEVVEYSDGWMAAVYLLCSNYMQDGCLRGRKSVSNLIRTSVFQRLGEEEQQILFYLAMMESCTPEQINFVTDNDQAAVFLFEMEQKIGFLQYVGGTGFFIHSMLRSVLEEEIARHGIAKREILLKNVRWFLQQKEYSNAITILNELECYEEIFEVLKEDPITICQECLGVLYEIFSKMPKEYRVKYCEQYLIFISIYIIKGNAGEALLLYGEIREEVDQMMEKVQDEMWLCQLTLLKIIYFFNDLGRMTKESLPLLERMGRKGRELYIQEAKRLFAVPNILRILHYEWGGLRNSLVHSRDYMKALEGEFPMKLSKEYGIIRVEYIYEMGDWKKAERLAQKELQRGSHEHNAILMVAAYQILLYTSIFSGNREKMQQYLLELEDCKQKYPEEMTKQSANLLLTDVYSTLGCEEKAWENRQEMDLKGSNYIMNTSGGFQYVYAKIMCCRKNYSELEFVADDILYSRGHGNVLYKQIYGKMFQAIAAFYQGREEEAVECLEELLEECSKDGIIMIFAENAPELLPILQKLKKSPFVEKVREICETCGKQIEKMRQPDIPKEKFLLTPRECEVMDLVEQGKKNAEIAEELHIAQITVEKTLSNIYRKLEVKNRAAALVKYEKLKME